MMRLLLALAAIVAVAVTAAAMIYQPKFAGEPVAIVAIPPVSRPDRGDEPPAELSMRETLKPGDEAKVSDPDMPAGAGAPESGMGIDVGEVTIIDPTSGSNGRVPEAGSERIRLARAPLEGMSEAGEFGPLPRISAQGRKPSSVYARPFRNRSARDAPVRIAILIGGMGISATATADAIQHLPGEVTLAFAPYGENLQSWVNRARSSGHEVMLQVPMEPFDYPDNDPGPHTLLTGLNTSENTGRINWLLSRFGGYIGITNYMGAKFTADPEAMSPVMATLSKRGLVYLDDGGSPRSRALDAAASGGVEARRADVVIDAEQSREGIEAAMRRLEEIAKERGSAIGVGSALPVTLETVVEWAKTLAARGIALAPVSAIVNPAEG